MTVTGTRDRILEAAAELLDKGGVDELSTRAVATAAEVSTPTIYREFGDKDGLLSAVIRQVLQQYWDDKLRVSFATDDALADLEQLFDLHIEFGLSHPYCYAVAYVSVPEDDTLARSLSESPFLLQVMTRLRDEGRLSTSPEQAARLMATAGIGSVLALLSTDPQRRDMSVAHAARSAVLDTIVVDRPGGLPADVSEPKVAAIALREVLRVAPSPELSPGESVLIDEWLQLLADCE
ncbi:TetR/AcrR family transcriptional regulator [Mycolicibacterium poriferae]|uniref:TetR/AcrR family transcriptional regulator n=1 Tax=Mycolicibacterium poriferae TaxID=39694 RepID=UPI0024BB9644|nr:TetR/AcrR family transcriptional regulator [Mycolicibacterium poriferae]